MRPSRGAVSSSRRPPCPSAMVAAIARPGPLPPRAREREGSARWSCSNTWAASCAVRRAPRRTLPRRSPWCPRATTVRRWSAPGAQIRRPHRCRRCRPGRVGDQGEQTIQARGQVDVHVRHDVRLLAPQTVRRASPRPLRSRCTTPTPGSSPARRWAVSSVPSVLALSTTVIRQGKGKPSDRRAWSVRTKPGRARCGRARAGGRRGRGKPGHHEGAREAHDSAARQVIRVLRRQQKGSTPKVRNAPRRRPPLFAGGRARQAASASRMRTPEGLFAHPHNHATIIHFFTTAAREGASSRKKPTSSYHPSFLRGLVVSSHPAAIWVLLRIPRGGRETRTT